MATIASMTAPGLASTTTILAAIHTIVPAVVTAFRAVLAALLAIVILSTHRQAYDAEDHHETEHYSSLYFHSSPFELEHRFSNQGPSKLRGENAPRIYHIKAFDVESRRHGHPARESCS
jgi:hypothetical protein